MKHNNLKSELRQAGASDTEVNELSKLAGNLNQLKNTKSMASLPSMKSQKLSKWRLLMPAGLALAIGLSIGMALAMLSQSVLPGSPLYPIQKLSDNVSMSVDPSYRSTVMMKSAQEVKQLIANHANSGLVLATLNDYMSQASIYRSTSTNYAAFEYCKDNLQQAANMATSPEHQAIERSLSSLNDV